MFTIACSISIQNEIVLDGPQNETRNSIANRIAPPHKTLCRHRIDDKRPRYHTFNIYETVMTVLFGGAGAAALMSVVDAMSCWFILVVYTVNACLGF